MLDDETTAEAETETAHDLETGEILPGDAEAPTEGAEEPKIIDISVEGLDLEAATLSGDLRDAVLGWFRLARKPWQQMSEGEQRAFSGNVDAACRQAIRGAVGVVTSYEFPTCPVTLTEMQIKGEKGIIAKIIAPNFTNYREVLGDYVGQRVMIVMADADDFLGERAPVQIDPDQGDLPIGEEDVPDPHPTEEPEPEPESDPEDGDEPLADGEDEEQLEPAD